MRHRRRPSRFLASLFTLIPGLVLAGCGGGGGGGGGSGWGDVEFAVTDAPSDTIDLFEVDVTSIQLHRLGGAVVEALPRTTRIDFADLVSASELFSRATIPAGTYDRVSLTLDFSGAAVHLDGQATNAAVLDVNGSPFGGPATLDVTLPNDRPIVITPGVARFVELDFDLDASTTIDTALNQVNVGTVLYVEAEPSAPKPVRAYGRLASRSPATSTFSMEVLRRRELLGGRERTVTVDASTVFDVDGTTATGAAGFALLGSRPLGARLEVEGSFDPATRVLLARAVSVGRAVFDGTRDFVEGLVVARTGAAGTDPVLIVRGTGVDRSVAVSFNRTFTVNASFANTRVLRQRAATGHDTDDVNVGQRVVAFGNLTGLVLDATVAGQGAVRLLETGLSGLATGAAAASILPANVLHIGRRPAAAFNFSVGGTVLANAGSLQIGTGALPLTGIVNGSAIVARGFFVPVDAPAVGSDFDATTVIDRSATASVLGARWATPNAAPFPTSSASGLSIGLAATAAAKLDFGGVAVLDLLGGSDPQLVPAATGGLFAIHEAGGVTLHRTFANWLADVQARLTRATGAVGASSLAAIGRWDLATRTLTARRLVIRLK